MGRIVLKCFVANGISQSCVLETVSMSKKSLACDWTGYKCCPQHSSSGHINADDMILLFQSGNVCWSGS
jgi:hypothetical protein